MTNILNIFGCQTGRVKSCENTWILLTVNQTEMHKRMRTSLQIKQERQTIFFFTFAVAARGTGGGQIFRDYSLTSETRSPRLVWRFILLWGLVSKSYTFQVTAKEETGPFVNISLLFLTTHLSRMSCIADIAVTSPHDFLLFDRLINIFLFAIYFYFIFRHKHRPPCWRNLRICTCAALRCWMNPGSWRPLTASTISKLDTLFLAIFLRSRSTWLSARMQSMSTNPLAADMNIRNILELFRWNCRLFVALRSPQTG